MLLPLIRLPPLSIFVGIFAAGTAYFSTNLLMSAATQLHSRMAEYFVEYRYPASYLDCLREELSQFIYHYIYHYITFITLNKTKTKRLKFCMCSTCYILHPVQIASKLM